MKPPAELGPRTAEASWITEGPNSGGVVGWWLYREHMFRFHQDFGGGDIGYGVQVEEWLRQHGETWPEIAAALRGRA
jgi:hypothetical protein